MQNRKFLVSMTSPADIGCKLSFQQCCTFLRGKLSKPNLLQVDLHKITYSYYKLNIVAMITRNQI